MPFPIQPGSPFDTNPPYSGTFIPRLWSSKMLVRFFETTVLGEITNTNWQGEIGGLGDTIRILKMPDVAVNDYQVGQSLTYPVMTPDYIDLNIDRGKAFTFQISDVLAYQSTPNLMDTFTTMATEQMAVAIDREVLLNSFNTGVAANKGTGAGAKSGSMNLGTDNAPVAATPANALQMLINLSTVLDEQNIPSSNRWIVISPYFRNLLFQSDLKMVYVTGDDGSPLRTGKIGMIDRFTVYVSNQLPTALAGQDFFGNAQAGALKRGAILAGHTEAITFATQYSKMETLRNTNDFGDLVRGLQVYGYRTVQPTALALGLIAM